MSKVSGQSARFVLSPGRLAALVSLTLLAACDPMKRHVTYIVTSPANAVDITSTNAYGETEQRLVKPPFMLPFLAVSHSLLSIQAQAMGPRGGVACEIVVDGVKLQSARSPGQGATVTCSLQAP
jgi:hypothetical protein